MKKFIISTNNATVQQIDAITTYLSKNSFGYWHWFQQTWLVVAPSDTWTAEVLRDKIIEFAKPHMIIIPMDNTNDTWAGFGVESHFEWVTENWKN